MAITRAQKETIVSKIKELLKESKLTLIVNYKGVPVSQFQLLRAQMEEAGIAIKVVKNRLLRLALSDLKLLKDDLPTLQGMLVYVFNPLDEVKGAQIIKSFIKNSNSPLEFVGAITETGQFMDKEEVVRLAGLASKPELIALTIDTLESPMNQIRSVLNSALTDLLLRVKASKI